MDVGSPPAVPVATDCLPHDYAPALLTAVHVALAILRRHRAGQAGAGSAVVFPSFLFPVTPWIWPSTAGIAVALVAHVAWFAVCEALAPPSIAAPRRSTPVNDPKPAAANRFETTSVVAVLDEGNDIKTFRLLRPHGFDFLAGQFVPVRVRLDGKPLVRCYSVSSSPDTRGYLEISVRRQGAVSTMLHATLRTGAAVVVGRPAGTFVYPAGDDRPVVLVAGGIGITPLLSMLRNAIASEPSRPVTLLYSARSENDLAFVSELRLIAERHAQVRIGITLTRPASATRWRTGRIDEAMVRQYVTHPDHSLFCICGPAQMIADTTTLLQTLGVPSSQIRSERFELAVAATALHTDSSGDAVAGRSADGRRADGRAHSVTFARSGRTAAAAPSLTLLEIAEAEGVEMASSCRSGVCQACRTRVREGTVDCRSDVLDPEDRAAGYVLPCVSWAVSDCVMEA
jgi:ferredoxin-NADP reductase